MTTHTKTILKEVQSRFAEPRYKGNVVDACTQTVMVEGGDVVAIHTNVLKKGLSSTGKPFQRWKRMQSKYYSYRPMKNGRRRLRVYNQGMRGGMNDFTKMEGDIDPVIAKAIERMISPYRKLPEAWWYSARPARTERAPLMKIAFPLFAHWEPWAIRSVGIRNMWAEDMAEFTRLTFGKTRYRKDLVKAVSKVHNPELIKIAVKLKSYVPIDWIINLLSVDSCAPSNFRYTAIEDANYKAIFSNLADHQKRSFMNLIIRALEDSQSQPDYIYKLDDTLNMLEQLGDNIKELKIKPSELQRVHDEASSMLNKIRYADKPIPSLEFTEHLNSLKFPTLTLETAVSTHQVTDWGIHMNHCIGSYNDLAVKGSAVLIALHQDGKFIGNASFRPVAPKSANPKWYCEQVFGKNNQYLPVDTLREFLEVLEKSVNMNNVWGFAPLKQDVVQ